MSDVPTIPGIDLTKSMELRTSRDPARERAQVAQLAQEFEAMLMLQMIRGMKQSMLDEDSSEGDLFGGETFGGGTLGDTFDTELAGHLARAGGIGLGDWLSARVKLNDADKADDADKSGATTGQGTGAGTGQGLGLTGVSALPLKEIVAPKGLDEGRSLALPATPTPAVSEKRHISANAGRQADMASDDFRLSMPLESVTTSAFGWRRDPLNGRQTFHHGVDLRAAYGDTVPAAAAGTVVFAGERGGYGNMVIVRHEGGVETRYAHLSSIDVAAGATVDEGTALGRAGSTGRSTAPHLHFEVLVNGERVDPERMARLGRGPLKFVSQADD
jgi:murein DD-endopeptidase MepM/ murein hydrolase activator NlpD